MKKLTNKKYEKNILSKLLQKNSKHKRDTQNSKNITTQKVAFTLAEVLITITIVGVVAAMVLPNLIQAYNIHFTETALKKFYSNMNNAIKLSTVEYGEPEYWEDYWAVVNTNTSNTYEVVKKYLMPSIKIKEVTYKNGRYYVLPDGSAVQIQGDITFYPKNFRRCVDRMSKKLSCWNRPSVGYCSFAFNFSGAEVAKGIKNGRNYYPNDKMEAFQAGWNWSRPNDLFTADCHGCNTTKTNQRGDYCTMIIKNNNWKIPKNYPRKISY